jgi:hypothetical protein
MHGGEFGQQPQESAEPGTTEKLLIDWSKAKGAADLR